MRSGIKITKQIKHTHKVRGRPPEDGSLDGGLMRLSNDLKEIIESEKQEGERLNDTVLRLVRERNFAKQEIEKLKATMKKWKDDYAIIEVD
jgi:predicted house-cleaning noncanonical NTP pyrophosphatase (MazG superfamily)